MTALVEMMLLLHSGLNHAGIPHGFGGTLALALCVEEARGTQDIDLNLFVSAALADRALAALPPEVEITEKNRADARAGQIRL